ncbi:MAG: hypothetical protein GX182_01855 [Firmicutes bacterium]|nr:hypothetical protein [Bacillota bacterium]
MKVGLALCLTMLLAMPAWGYEIRWQEDNFPMDSLLQVCAVDLTGDGQDELLILGRNYELREVFLQVLGWNGGEFITLGRSENLFGAGGHYTMAVGRFQSEDLEIIILNGDRAIIHKWLEDSLVKVWEGKSPGEAGAVGTLRGSPDLLVITDVREVRLDTLVEGMTSFSWTGQGWRKEGETPPIGRIRALAAEGGEIAIEVGPATKPGKVQIWRWDGEFRQLSSSALCNCPVFALALGPASLITADDRGRVAAYDLDQGKPKLRQGGPHLGWALVSVTRLSLHDGDGLVVAGYPSRLYLLMRE